MPTLNQRAHNSLTAADLHFAKIDVEVGPPISTPTYLGQTWLDSNTNILYVSNGTSSVSNWVIVNYIQTQSVSSNTTISAANALTVYVDCSAGAVTVTLPAIIASINGLAITVVDVKGSAFVYNITVARNGGTGTIQNAFSNWTIDSNSAAFTFICSYSSTDWRVV